MRQKAIAVFSMLITHVNAGQFRTMNEDTEPTTEINWIVPGIAFIGFAISLAICIFCCNHNNEHNRNERPDNQNPMDATLLNERTDDNITAPPPSPQQLRDILTPTPPSNVSTFLSASTDSRYDGSPHRLGGERVNP